MKSNHTHSALAQAHYHYIPEWEDFLGLFPHRADYLWSHHPRIGDRPNWQSESRHFLGDRLLKQASYLYGVRFGATTNYLMLDIDQNSQYHPCSDPFAVGRIVEALEPIGLLSYVAVTSSYSGGIHLYFPFMLGYSSWSLGQCVSIVLTQAGFDLTPGQLEVFPNAKADKTALFNGHRLPLQQGSYLLGDDWEPCFGSKEMFVRRWNYAALSNPLQQEALATILRMNRRSFARIRGRAEKFLNDLNAEIEPGWTGYGQTNFILGRIAMREYIFRHALDGGEPLSGTRLEWQIIRIATSLPGFEHYCRHEAEVPQKVGYWVRCIERSSYYRYGRHMNGKVKDNKPPNQNDQRAEDARRRIREAVNDLQMKGEFPETVRDRHLALKGYKIGSKTLYKNKDLWHLENALKPAQGEQIHTTPAESDHPRSLEPGQGEQIHTIGPISLAAPSASAPKAHGQKGSLNTEGGAGGGSTPIPPATNAKDIAALLRSIQADQQRKRASPRPLLGDAPDELWFHPERSPETEDHG